MALPGKTNGNGGTVIEAGSGAAVQSQSDKAAMTVLAQPGGVATTAGFAGPIVVGGVDCTADPFALMDMNDADQELGAVLPLRRIEYCASKESEGLTAGWITDTATRTQKQSVQACLVALKFARLLMGRFNPSAPRDDPSRKPICASSDGVRRTRGMGMGMVEVEFKDGTKREVRVQVSEGQTCKDCPYQKWPDGQKRPVCSESFNLLLADLEDGGTPFMVNIWHTGIKPLRTFRNALKAAALRWWRPKDGVPANMRVRFVFSAVPEQRWYLPVFADFVEMPVDEARRLATGLGPIVAAFNSQDTTEIATQDMVSEEDLAAADAGERPEPQAGQAGSDVPVEQPTMVDEPLAEAPAQPVDARKFGAGRQAGSER